MTETFNAIVTNIMLDKYILEDDNSNIIEAGIRGNAKKKSNVLVGDKVTVEKTYDKYIITDILERKNSLIRPPVANIDNVVIVVSIDNPKPDYILLDKEIALCISKNITPIICVNKVDLENTSDIAYIKEVYGKLGIKICFTSAKTGDGIDELINLLHGRISAFSGNSGVGKSSLSKKIMKDEDIVIGNIADKTKKGKHTTKHVRLYKIDKKTYILDTPGFSSFELYGITYKELKMLYPEFKNIECDYSDCNHVLESSAVCKVKKEVEEGKIDKARYDRYVYLFEKLKELDDKKYK